MAEPCWAYWDEQFEEELAEWRERQQAVAIRPKPKRRRRLPRGVTGFAIGNRRRNRGGDPDGGYRR